MAPEPGTPTLDQLRVFLAVVESGSFAGAARRLGRATSVMSYAIANLEAQLGVSLFDRDGTRTPRLTEAGKVVLGEARSVAAGIDGLRARVRSLLQGLEAEIQLAIDVMLPAARVTDALKAFQAAFPTVTLRLHVEVLGAITQMVLDRRATIGISGPLPGDTGIAGLDRIGVGTVTLVPVAAPDHPLASAQATPGMARDHVQLVLTDRSSLTEGLDFAVVANRTWRLADMGAKHSLLREGIGWGTMPLPMVEDDLRQRRLVQLRLPELQSDLYRFDAIYRTDTPPGPAGSWLVQRFLGQVDDGASATGRMSEPLA